MNTKITSLFIALLCSASLFAGGDKITTQEYIDTWKETAIRNMREFGIPASITLAQGILESASGNSMLAKKGNNHFGIKCHGWEGGKIYHDDDKKGECFRKYNSAAESFEDHSLFLKNKSRYAFLFDYKSDDYKSWAKGLKKAGYATNPKYPQLLMAIIEKWELYKFDEDISKPRKEKVDKEIEEVKAKPVIAEKVITLDRGIDLSDNNIKYTRAKAGDSVKEIAEDLELATWQITKYNDISEKHTFNSGELVYIQPKRRKNCSVKKYEITEEDDLRLVSQKLGIKPKHILRLNRLEDFSTIHAGDSINTCKRVKK
ncbi:glycoside hydrolase family 73 protein [Luteibaculum oceani]|uniref:N-acetylmuramoyl-L-alanine amidase n=1 Tax=Luteibaculum oceani TaxID=1294296 RepID=A0A5C6V0B8_9FLAO|nr:glucosaminidase domain-containing protein [Luteibaculum oceani]TXC78344.1 N-acetylmuramoyl-L-alanine amidase [Luteibaculum oceani]